MYLARNKMIWRGGRRAIHHISRKNGQLINLRNAVEGQREKLNMIIDHVQRQDKTLIEWISELYKEMKRT